MKKLLFEKEVFIYPWASINLKNPYMGRIETSSTKLSKYIGDTVIIKVYEK